MRKNASIMAKPRMVRARAARAKSRMENAKGKQEGQGHTAAAIAGTGQDEGPEPEDAGRSRRLSENMCPWVFTSGSVVVLRGVAGGKKAKDTALPGEDLYRPSRVKRVCLKCVISLRAHPVRECGRQTKPANHHAGVARLAGRAGR